MDANIVTVYSERTDFNIMYNSATVGQIIITELSVERVTIEVMYVDNYLYPPGGLPQVQCRLSNVIIQVKDLHGTSEARVSRVTIPSARGTITLTPR